MGKEMQCQCLVGRVLALQEKRDLEVDGINSCPTVYIYVIILNYTSSLVMTVNFVACIGGTICFSGCYDQIPDKN